MTRVDPDAPQETERFDPRISEPAAELALIPVIRPANADEPAAMPDSPLTSALPPGSPAPGSPPPGSPAPAAGDPVAGEEPVSMPAADAPLTEPPLSEPVPTSVLAPADADAVPPPSPEEVPEPDVTVPYPLVTHGPEDRSGRRRGRRAKTDRAVFEETLPTQALVMVDRLQASPYGRRMRSTLRQRRDTAQESLEARTTLDFALKLGETMFSYGASSLEVETSIIVVTQAYGIHETEVDLTNQAISLNYAPDSSHGVVPYTLQRVVRTYSTDYRRLAAVHRLVEQISDGAIERHEAQRRLVEIRHQPRAFPPGADLISAAVFTAAFIPLIGGSWVGSLLGFASTIVVFWAKGRMDRARVPEIYSTMVGSFLATAIALAAFAMDAAVNPAMVVAGGIMMLLPTARFVTAVQDAINGFPVTSAGRIISALLVFIGLMGGIMVAVAAADLAGLERLNLAEHARVEHSPALLLVLVMVATMAFCVVEQSRWSFLSASAAVSGVAYLVFVLVDGLGFSAGLAPAVAASTIGFLGRIAALRLGAPPLIVVLPSVLFLMPGFAIFRALYEFTVETDSTLVGVAGIFNAAVVVVAIAAGAVLGDTLARPLTDRLSDGRPHGTEARQR